MEAFCGARLEASEKAQHSTAQQGGEGTGDRRREDMMSCHLMVEERILEGKEGCGGWAFLLENFFFNQSFHLPHTRFFYAMFRRK